MNALVIIDTDALTPATVFAPGGVEGIISKLETDVRAIDRDISTTEGRESVKSLAYKIARSKTALDDMGKELVAGIKAQAATIDAERRTIRDRLDALRDEVRDPVTAWETAEAKRIEDHENTLVWLIQLVDFAIPPTSTMIRERIALAEIKDKRDWQEFSERAGEAFKATIGKLFLMRDAAEQAERDAAELAELRALKVEREEADRKAAEAAQAAEQARLIAEAKAARDAQEAAAAAERERQRAEQAERDKAAAVAKAIEGEQRRAAAEKAAEQERQRIEAGRQAARAANKKHQEKVHGKIAAALIASEHCHAESAAAIVELIADRGIPHLSITY